MAVDIPTPLSDVLKSISSFLRGAGYVHAMRVLELESGVLNCTVSEESAQLRSMILDGDFVSAAMHLRPLLQKNPDKADGIQIALYQQMCLELFVGSYSVGSDQDNAHALRDSRQQLQMLMADDAFDDFEEVFSAAHIQHVPGYERWTPHKGRLQLAEQTIAALHMNANSNTQDTATATSLLRAFARSAVSHCDQLPRSLAGSGAFYSPSLDAVVTPGGAGGRAKRIAAPSVGVIQVTRDTDPPTFLSSLVQPARPAVSATLGGSAGPATATATATDPDDIPFVEAARSSSRRQGRSSRRSGRRKGEARKRHAAPKRRAQPEHKQEHTQLAVRFDAGAGDSDSASWRSGSPSSRGSSGHEATLSDDAAAPPSGLSRVQRVHTPAKHPEERAPDQRVPVAFSVDMTGGGGSKKKRRGGAPRSQAAPHQTQPMPRDGDGATVADEVQRHQDARPKSEEAAAAAAAAAGAPPVAWEITLSPQDAAAQGKQRATPGRPKRSFFSPPHRRAGRQQQTIRAEHDAESAQAAPPPTHDQSAGDNVHVPSTHPRRDNVPQQRKSGGASHAPSSPPSASLAAAQWPTQPSPNQSAAASTPSPAARGGGGGGARGSMIPALRKSPDSSRRASPGAGASPADATAGALREALATGGGGRSPPPSPFEGTVLAPRTQVAAESGADTTAAPAWRLPAADVPPEETELQGASTPAGHNTRALPPAQGAGQMGLDGAESARSESEHEQDVDFDDTAGHRFVSSPASRGAAVPAAVASPDAPASPARSVAADDVLLPWHFEQRESIQWQESAALTAALPVRCSAFDGTGRYCAIGTNSKALLIARLPEALFDASDPAVQAADEAHWGEASDRVHRVAVPSGASQAPLDIVREYAPFHAGSVYSIAWGNNSGNDCSALAGTAPSSSLLATCSNDTAIHVLKWQGEGQGDVCGDTSGPEPVAVIRGHSGTLRSVAFLSAGTLASGGGRDFNVRLWDVSAMRTGAVQEAQSNTETELQCLQGHSGTVFGVCRYSSLGAKQPQLLSCSDDGSVRLWDCRAAGAAKVALHVCSVSGTPVAVHGVAVDHMSGCSAGHAAPIAAACADGHVRLLDIRGTRAGGVVDSAAFHTGSDCRTVAFAPGGDLLASGGFDGTVAVSSSSLGVLSAKYRMACAHTDKVLSVAWHPWAPVLATTGADNAARIWAGHA